MENEQESEWDELLGTYRVADADEAMLDRIIAAAAESKVIVFKRPAYRSYLLNGSVAAALAVLGFFSGYATLPATDDSDALTRDSSGTKILDRVILGPKSYSEIDL